MFFSHPCSESLLTSFPPTEPDLNIVICGPQKMSVSTLASLASLGYANEKIFSYNS
jgi:hypothetical protein